MFYPLTKGISVLSNVTHGGRTAWSFFVLCNVSHGEPYLNPAGTKLDIDICFDLNVGAEIQIHACNDNGKME